MCGCDAEHAFSDAGVVAYSLSHQRRGTGCNSFVSVCVSVFKLRGISTYV